MGSSRARPRTRLVVGTAAALAAAAGLALPLAFASTPPATTQAVGPRSFVSGLDLECFDTQGPALDQTVVLTHLNPVLRQLGLPAHQAVIGALAQTCVPVAKNGVTPAADVLAFIQHVDLACYKITTPSLSPVTTLVLKHLNPVLVNLPSHNDTLLQAEQLCIPVGKNGVKPPDTVLKLVQFIDLECYRTEATAHPTFGVTLKQLNPQLANIPAHQMTLTSTPRQLCVPVQKNQQVIPTDSLNIIQWIDLEKFPASPLVNIAPVNVVLDHLNPLFTTLPRVPVTLRQASALMVPVSKNGAVPPLP